MPSPASPKDWLLDDWWTREDPRNYIAGEASYRDALNALTGPVCPDGYCEFVVVRLVRERGNEWDSNALRALVDCQDIGHLRRGRAAKVAPLVDDRELSWFDVPGILRGGSDDAPYVGCHIWLGHCVSHPDLTLPVPRRDPEFEVPWPPQGREKALLRRSRARLR